jgi:hypothetical protein
VFRRCGYDVAGGFDVEPLEGDAAPREFANNADQVDGGVASLDGIGEALGCSCVTFDFLDAGDFFTRSLSVHQQPNAMAALKQGLPYMTAYKTGSAG